MPGKAIVVLATLDTKGKEAAYLKTQIEEYGDRVILVDSGVTGDPQAEADITREGVSKQGGTPLKTLLENPSREIAAHEGKEWKVKAVYPKEADRGSCGHLSRYEGRRVRGSPLPYRPVSRRNRKVPYRIASIVSV